jgi:hypothetical protein
MKISEVIAELAGIQAKHGDLDVYVSKDDEGNAITNFDEAVVWEEISENLDKTGRKVAVLFRDWTELEGGDWE